LVEIAGKSQMRGIEALYNEESSFGPSEHQETFADAENNPFFSIQRYCKYGILH